VLITRKDLTFLPRQGFYNASSKNCYNAPGFSAVMRHGEQDWTKTMDANKLKKATQRGTNFDSCIQAYYANKSCDLAQANLLKSTANFIQHIEPIEQEIFAYSILKNQPILGFIDAIANLEKLLNVESINYTPCAEQRNGLTVIDWKTKASSKFNPKPLGKNIIQISVYARLCKEFYNLDITQGCIVLAFADGAPCKVLWVDKLMMQTAMQLFYNKLIAYKKDITHSWRGEYELN